MDDLRKQNAKVSDEQVAAQGKPAVSVSEAFFRRPNGEVPASDKPVLIDPEDLKKILTGLTNMALAHEIALDKDFRLKKPERNTEAPVSQEVQAALEAKEKYWEKVDQILVENNIKEAKNTIMDLIHTLRTMLHSTLLPHNVKLRQKIDQELDMQKVSKEVDNDAFDFFYYMKFILDTLSMLCCPARDVEIVEIRNIEIPSRQVRKTIDLMENMNLDMANFIIDQSRPHIIQNCVTYERTKFASYVELQYKIRNDPIIVTRDWLLRHVIPDRSYSEVMAHAYLEILEWDHKDCPETLTLDWGRFPPIREEIRRLTVLAAMVAALCDYAQTYLLESPENQANFEKSKLVAFKNFLFLKKFGDELNLLFTCEEVADPKKFQEALERCCIQTVHIVEQYLLTEKGKPITQSQKDSLVGLIRPLIDLNHPVRLLYYRRVKEWFVELAKVDGKGSASPPSNLYFIASLIQKPVTELLRIAMHNRSVYDVVYKEIFEGKCPVPTVFPSAADEASSDVPVLDEGIVNILMKLQGIEDKTLVYKKFQVEKPAIPNDLDRQVWQFVNTADPAVLLGCTAEQLLQIMERQDIADVNKLRRIRERLGRNVLDQRLSENLPLFENVLQEELGPSETVQQGASAALPNNANDASKQAQTFHGASSELTPANPMEQHASSSQSSPATKESTNNTDRAEEESRARRNNENGK